MTNQQYTHTGRILAVSARPHALTDYVVPMESAGWDVTVCADEVEAVAAICVHAVDLVIIHDPAGAPVRAELVSSVRDMHGSDSLPVVVVSHRPGSARDIFLNAGADDVICQMASMAEVVSRVRVLMRFKKLHDELDATIRRERRILDELKQDNAKLQVLCTTDPLTHLANVRNFQDMLAHEFKIAKRYEQPLSLLMIDVDHFKVINDTYGHPSGDYVLKELAVVLTTCLRESDVVARIGGEEFAVILPQADAKKAERFAERLRKEVYGRKFEVFGCEIHVTISIGVATWPANAEITDPEMLLFFSDQALLRAKEDGRDRVVSVHKLDMEIRRRFRRSYRRQCLTVPVRPDGDLSDWSVAPEGGAAED